MNRKIVALLFFASALTASFAQADPSVTASVSPNLDGNLEWQIAIDPDESLYTDQPSDFPDQGVGGSLAVELAFKVDPGVLLDATINEADWPFESVGINPFTDDITFGLWTDQEAGLVLVFAAFGSEFFTSPDPVLLLTLETESTAASTLYWGTLASGDPVNGSLISQGGEEFYGQSGLLVWVPVPEPASIVLVGAAALAVILSRRRKQ